MNVNKIKKDCFITLEEINENDTERGAGSRRAAGWKPANRHNTRISESLNVGKYNMLCSFIFESAVGHFVRLNVF